MVAIVQLSEKNGSGLGILTDKTSSTIRFKTADNATVDTINPIIIPAAGSAWSYEKWLIANVTVPPSVQIANIRWYMDGSNSFGTGVNLWARAVTAYNTPALGTSSTGYSDAFSFTSGASLVTGSSVYTGTGQKGDHAVFLMEVTNAASSGSLTAETLTLSYDEI